MNRVAPPPSQGALALDAFASDGRPTHAPEPKRHQRDRFWRLIKHGDTRNEYESDLRFIGALVGIAVSRGISIEHLLRQLGNPTNAAWHAYHAVDRHGRRRMREEDVRTWYDRDLKKVLPIWHATEFRQHVGELRAAALEAAWPARQAVGDRSVKGDTLKRIYLAHLAIALRHGATYPASARAVADAAEVSRGTASLAAQALTDLKLIRRAVSTGERTGWTAGRYSVVVDPDFLRGHLSDNGYAVGREVPSVVRPMTAPLGHPSAHADHPAFRWGTGLMHDVWVALVLSDGTATVSSLSAQLKRQPRTVRRQVAALVDANLAERIDEHAIRACLSVPALDAAADQHGATYSSHRQRKRHREERDSHALQLAIRKAKARGEKLQTTSAGVGIAVNVASGEVRSLRPSRASVSHSEPQLSLLDEPATHPNFTEFRE